MYGIYNDAYDPKIKPESLTSIKTGTQNLVLLLIKNAFPKILELEVNASHGSLDLRLSKNQSYLRFNV